jgi:hypothetical protein
MFATTLLRGKKLLFIRVKRAEIPLQILLLIGCDAHAGRPDCWAEKILSSAKISAHLAAICTAYNPYFEITFSSTLRRGSAGQSTKGDEKQCLEKLHLERHSSFC